MRYPLICSRDSSGLRRLPCPSRLRVARTRLCSANESSPPFQGFGCSRRSMLLGRELRRHSYPTPELRCEGLSGGETSCHRSLPDHHGPKRRDMRRKSRTAHFVAYLACHARSSGVDFRKTANLGRRAVLWLEILPQTSIREARMCRICFDRYRRALHKSDKARCHYRLSAWLQFGGRNQNEGHLLMPL